MATKNIAKMKNQKSARPGSAAIRHSKYMKYVALVFLATVVVGIGLHLAEMLPPGMAKYITVRQ